MKTDKKAYAEMTKRAAPKSPKAKDFLWAFLVGGAICALGQGLGELFKYLGLSEDIIKMLIPVSLIFLSAFFTTLQLFDNLARRAGAGTLVPITGFANAMVSNAMEFKTEGLIFGTGVKLFTIAGPVIVYGTVASVVYGIIYWIIKIITGG